MTDTTMCEACQKQSAAKRYDGPHSYLRRKSCKDVGSMVGSSCETEYVCIKCGHEWLHETGSCGMGWVS
jgi:hypothetical protein